MTATSTQHVKIGASFFAKIKNDYTNWRRALIREFLQNCFDAPGSKRVEIEIVSDGASTVLTVTNDGAPMDHETLTTKLLTLGGSGKNFTGDATGGFGVAKSLLYYCHAGYVISTGDQLVRGQGAQYTIANQEYFHGTTSIVTLDGDEAEALISEVERFAQFSQWSGELTCNGKVLDTSLRKGARRRDLGWAVVYTNNSFANTCLVRLNGQPMFSSYTRFKGCVLIELVGRANETLTSNRDGLRGEYASELSDLLTQLAVDKRSALREQRAEYKRYQGEMQRNEAKKPKDSGTLEGLGIDIAQVAALVQGEETVLTGTPASTCPAPATATGGSIKLVTVSAQDVKTVSVGPQFILKNSTGRKVPTYYTPGDGFTRYSRELVRSWTALLLKLHQLCNRSGEFSVGFSIDEETEAECEQGIYGRVYYINPVKIGDRKMEQRFEGAWQNRFELISLAAHEFVHGAYGLGEHDEDYAGKLTEVMAVVMRNMDELIDLCRPVAKSPDALPASPLNFRERRIEVLGHALTSVIKWMGRDGWSFCAARDVLATLGVDANENTVRTSLHDGRQDQQHGTKIAELTEKQVEELRRLYRIYA